MEEPFGNANKKSDLTEEQHKKFWQKVINDDAMEYNI